MVTRPAPTPLASTRPPAPGWGLSLAAVCVIGATVYAAMALSSSGAATWVGALTSVSFLLAAAAALLALAAPRRRLATTPPTSATTEIAAPLALPAMLLAAWALVAASALAWTVLAFTDFDAIETPGAAYAVVLGALGSIPEAIRLARGELHRWRIIVDDRTLTYRGYRTDVSVPWDQVRGVRLHTSKPIGVLVDLRANQPDFVIPSTAFLVPAEQILALIERRGSA